MFAAYYFAAVLIINVLALQLALKLGDDCNFDDGSKGVCVGIKDCQEAIALLEVGEAQKVCSYDEAYPIVCCNNTNVQKPGDKSFNYCKEILVPEEREESLITPYIIGGGENSLSQEFPHMAALGYDNNGVTLWGCGGSLISLEFVLTAAHCLHSVAFGVVKYVRLGDLILSSNYDDASPQNFGVRKIYKHPGYKRPSKYNDIALLKLHRKAKVTDYVRPACLNIKKNVPENAKYIATGWGLLSFQGEASDHLQKVNVLGVGNSECNGFYEINERFYNKGIDNATQLCAGNPGKDTCQGDSGGPLQIKVNKRSFIHGVTSFGKACLLTKSPGVYTRVSNYIDWIESIVWP